MYSIELYVIKFVSALRQIDGFLCVLQISSTDKTDHHDISEILLQVALTTITLTLNPSLRLANVSCCVAMNFNTVKSSDPSNSKNVVYRWLKWELFHLRSELTDKTNKHMEAKSGQN